MPDFLAFDLGAESGRTEVGTLESLALKYRAVLEQLQQMASHPIRGSHD